ncbi:helix-turn-helix domain-containing protein [Piscirickettsia litoralis]|uniref:HTH cro/C1-type domain-containing protein n=1 Tax=Piscirickettsia litoralis TaxID=1891921 RepID=A0ABX2ZXA4_9GAMM|nr:helix-turn-helix transcriptional regulator [Piscirickettsia litoralis]ODN41113.1 hypothetical protein BGC07_17720 [Piscirickettsia litoralis]
MLGFSQAGIDKAVALRQARQILGFSQGQLARELGWSAKQVSNLETGVRQIQKQTELAIETLLRRSGKWDSFLSKIRINVSGLIKSSD